MEQRDIFGDFVSVWLDIDMYDRISCNAEDLVPVRRWEAERVDVGRDLASQ